MKLATRRVSNWIVTTRKYFQLVVEEINSWNCAVTARDNDLLRGHLYCVPHSVELGIVNKDLLGCDFGRGQIEGEIIAIYRVLFNSKKLQTIFVWTEIPSCDIGITYSGTSSCLEECRESRNGKRSFEENEEEARNLDCRDVIENECVFNGSIVGVYQQDRVFLYISVLVDICCPNHFVILHVS